MDVPLSSAAGWRFIFIFSVFLHEFRDYRKKYSICILNTSVSIQHPNGNYNSTRVWLFAVWQEVEQKLEDGGRGELADNQGPVQYSEKTPSAAMKSKFPWLLNYLQSFRN